MNDNNKADEAGDQAIADLLGVPMQLVQLVRKSDRPATSVVAQEEEPARPEAATETEPPLAPGVDSWWERPVTAAETAKLVKETEESAAFLRQRYEAIIDGRPDPGGFGGQQVGPFDRPRNFDWRHMPRMLGWR